MSQRAKRGSKKSQNRIDHMSVSTGGWTARQSTAGKDSEVNVEPKKEEAPRRGLAKASPAFKAVKAKLLPSKDDEKKVIASNTIEKKTKEKDLDD